MEWDIVLLLKANAFNSIVGIPTLQISIPELKTRISLCKPVLSSAITKNLHNLLYSSLGIV